MTTVPKLHLVTPASTDDGPDLVGLVDAVVAAGAPLVQIRLKHLPDRERLARTAELTARIQSGGALALVNDRVDLALAVGADGVHLGDEDLPVDVARRLLGPRAVIGATARDAEGARLAQAAGADYLGVGPTYTTTTKVVDHEPLGPAGVAAVAAAVDVPVVAIAGVTVDRTAGLLAAGAHGIAVVGAVFGASDPATAVGDFLRVLDGER